MYFFFSIYQIHDKTKDKNFLLELSMITEGTEGKHKILGETDEEYIEAKAFGEGSLNDDGNDSE